MISKKKTIQVAAKGFSAISLTNDKYFYDMINVVLNDIML